MESCLHPCPGRIPNAPLHSHESMDQFDRLNEIECWAKKVAELGRPHFGEFASRLEEVLGAFQQSCGNVSCGCKPRRCESCSCSNESGLAGEKSVELNSDIRSEVLKRMEEMIRVLRCEESCFTSWQAACRRFDEICMLIPQVKATASVLSS